MTSWKLTLSIAAIALCSSATITTSNARADQFDDVNESSVSIDAITSDNNDFHEGDGDRDHDYNFDDDWHRHGYGNCYAYCDDVRDDCMRRYYRGYNDWRGGDRDDDGRRGHHDRWDNHHHEHDAYRFCEQRFNYCLNTCRDSRWGGR